MKSKKLVSPIIEADFPCARIWRCGYSGEPYYPDAEEVRRAEQLAADMEAILGAEYLACPYNVKYRTA